MKIYEIPGALRDLLDRLDALPDAFKRVVTKVDPEKPETPFVLTQAMVDAAKTAADAAKEAA